MGSVMEKDKLEQMAEELAKGVTSEKDLSASFSELMKKTLEKALQAEMMCISDMRSMNHPVGISRTAGTPTVKRN
jgi:hypothetical protein